MKKVILKKDGLFVEEDLTIDIYNGIISLSQEGWTPLTFRNEDSKEVVLAICPELETEKIEFAIQFKNWFNALSNVEKCTIHPPAGSGGSHGIYNKTDEDLIKQFINSTTNGNT